MLKKLLKYDFKAIFKHWWIAAVISLALCIMGGCCTNVFNINRELPSVVLASARMMLSLSVIGLCAFAIISVILVIARFYKNFFTDEGYLTFTLPVKRSSLLTSKLIVSVTALFATTMTVIINVVIILLISYAEDIFTKYFWNEVAEFFVQMFETLGVYTPVLLLEIVIIIALLIAFSVLFAFCCITFASIITKKARIITALAIYYGANTVFGFAFQIFALFSCQQIFEQIYNAPESSQKMMVSLVMLGIIVLLAMFCSMLYALEYWMLDRKLNLA